MKVFISWSGARSKNVALIFRDWLPTVIQALEPFVSSEDIEKGARWNTDIAQELKESTFGLICVTKDNLTSPWLNFEAGALSKTIENSYVAPLLFEVKPSDLKGSPISQFQATTFTREDMKRLVETLNAATGNCLTAARLDKAFELCYPDLEKSITELKESSEGEETEESESSVSVHFDPNILEELLEMTRNTQRLLGNTDAKLYTNLDQVQKKVDDVLSRMEKQYDIEMRRISRISRSRFIDEMLFSSYNEFEGVFPYNILMTLSVFKTDFPWLYDAGRDLVRVLESNSSKKSKATAIMKFRNVLEFTCGHPAIREISAARKESLMMLRELPHILDRELDHLYIQNTGE